MKRRRRRRKIKTGPVDAVNAGGDGEKRSAKHRMLQRISKNGHRARN